MDTMDTVEIRVHPRNFQRVIRDAQERGATVSRRPDGRYLIDEMPVILDSRLDVEPQIRDLLRRWEVLGLTAETRVAESTPTKAKAPSSQRGPADTRHCVGQCRRRIIRNIERVLLDVNALDRLSQGGVATMTPYDFAMEEVTLAIGRVADALIANEPFALAQECTDARRVYRDMLELYPKLQLRATERDSLLGGMILLGSQLSQCEAFLQRPFADAGVGSPRRAVGAIHLPHFCKFEPALFAVKCAISLREFCVNQCCIIGH